MNRERRRLGGFKPSSNKDDGADKRALLLAGPPGIGKTSTAHVVAAEAGFEVIEFNASDTRSKKSLEVCVRTGTLLPVSGAWADAVWLARCACSGCT